MEKICFVGGDARMEYAARALVAAGYTVTRVENELPGEQDVLVLPVKCCQGDCISGTRIALDEVARAKERGSLIIGGGLPEALGGLDYMQNEALLYENARLTAEGALMLLGNNTKGALLGADVGLLGMGRIAECLCLLLHAVDAHVTVYARRAEALCRARAMGARTVRFRERLPRSAAEHQMLCNTVPHVLVGEELIAHMRHDTLLLELASAPGGFDRAAAQARGLLYVNGQGLPGKYAPRAAGELIAAYVLDALRGENTI